jgi:hypothetical protein
MSGFLLDTNCISEVVRVSPDPRVLGWEGIDPLRVLLPSTDPSWKFDSVQDR